MPPIHLRGLLAVCLFALGLFSLLGTLAVQGAAPRSDPPAWGSPVRINPQSSITPSIQRNFALAVDPTDPNRVLASYDSWNNYLTDSAFARSTDAGRTWQADWFYGPWITDAMPNGNTSVAADAWGTFYYATQVLGSTNYGYVVLTTTAASPWSTPVPVVMTGPGEYYDQAHLAVDPRAARGRAGSLYFVSRFFGNDALGLALRYSRDHGQTWSAPVTVSDPDHVYNTGPSLTVGADGTVYVAFAYLPNNFAGADVSFYLERSTDGGVTWSGDMPIAPPVTKIGALDGELHELLLPSDNASPPHGVGVVTVPFIAVAPNAPDTIYAVWNDGRWERSFSIYGHTGQHSDIAFSRSTDAGHTWSDPLRLNDDPPGNAVDQFDPAIAVRAGGPIGVTWHDRRNDPEHFLYDLYYSQSTDGGLTWSANQRVSDQSSNPLAVPNGELNGVMSAYTALVFGPDYVLPSWIDTRAGYSQDFYTARGVLDDTPVPTPSPTPASTETAPPTATRPPSTTPSAPPSPTASPTACALQFSDVPPAAYYAPAVQWLACRQVVAGYACGGAGEPCDPANDPYFRPAANHTRGQLSKLVVLGFGWPIQTPSSATFRDVPSGSPFYAYVETATARGVLSGYQCGSAGEPCPGRYFRPPAATTRGQLSKILVGAKGWPIYTPPTPTFADVPPSSPFFGFVERAVAAGVLSGYSCGSTGEPCPGRYFRPSAAATRGQLSKILYNVLISP